MTKLAAVVVAGRRVDHHNLEAACARASHFVGETVAGAARDVVALEGLRVEVKHEEAPGVGGERVAWCDLARARGLRVGGDGGDDVVGIDAEAEPERSLHHANLGSAILVVVDLILRGHRRQ